MKQCKLIFLVLFAGLLLLGTACGSAEPATAANLTQTEDEDHADDGHSEANMDHAHVEAPEEFASLKNPFAADHEAIEIGEELFQAYCASCHGPEGAGDGPAAESLEPKPAALSDGMMMNMLSDGYLFWRVSQGGQMEPFNSAMPAWQAALTEEQRWQIISYVRTLADEEQGHMEDDHMNEDEHMEDNH
ncbi:MAG: cytochrome c [Ardenticatenaceae bacterium]|nr:cytochrome c [Ardenticatenaceae bacterium]